MQREPEFDDYRAKLVARAADRADLAHQAVARLASLDEEVVLGVLERTPDEVRELHVEGVFAGEPPTDDLGEGLNNIFANMTRMAASIRKRPTPNDAAKARTILLLDDLQILHQQLDLLQKFLLANDLLSELARSAYANKYRSPGPAEVSVEPESSDRPADEPMTSEVAPSPRQPAAPTIVVTCGHCARQFTAPESLAGKEVACLNCRRPLSVPQASTPAASQRPKAAAPISAPAASSSSIQIPVACPQCRARFLAQSWLAGRSVNCPSCGQKILVPDGTSPTPIDLTYDTDPLSDLPDLGDLSAYASSPPARTSRRVLPAQSYSARRTAARFDGDELPRWAWYAMGGALGLGALTLLIILISSLWRTAPRPDAPSTPPPAGSAPAGVAAKSPDIAVPSLQLRTYTSERGGYSILMPTGVNPDATPVFQSSVTRYAESVVLPNGGGVFEVSYGDRPLAANPDAELRAYWQAWAEREQLSVTSTDAMEHVGDSVLDIRFVSASGPFPAGRLRLMLIKRGEGHRLYAILRAGPAKCDEGGEVESFFGYFSIL